METMRCTPVTVTISTKSRIMNILDHSNPVTVLYELQKYDIQISLLMAASIVALLATIIDGIIRETARS